MIKQCSVCKREFECQKSTAKYCSKTCANKAKYQREKANKLLGQVDKYCLICGKPFRPIDKNANQRTCCYECMPLGTQLGRSGFLDLLRKQRGGKCERCGYDTYLGALDFHHVNPTEKDFTIGNRDYKLIECVEESKKCILICANCHREIHAGLWDIQELLKQKAGDVKCS